MCGSRAQECRLSSCGSLGFVALQHVGSSPARDQTCVPCTGRWIFIHCATREVRVSILDKLQRNSDSRGVKIDYHLTRGGINNWQLSFLINCSLPRDHKLFQFLPHVKYINLPHSKFSKGSSYYNFRLKSRIVLSILSMIHQVQEHMNYKMNIFFLFLLLNN